MSIDLCENDDHIHIFQEFKITVMKIFCFYKSNFIHRRHFKKHPESKTEK